MPDWLFWVLLIPVGLLALVAGGMIVIVSIIVIRAREATLMPAQGDQYAAPIRSAQAHDAWAEAHGFDPAGTFVLNLLTPGFIAAWQHKHAPTYLCLYWFKEGDRGRYNYDLVTGYRKGA